MLTRFTRFCATVILLLTVTFLYAGDNFVFHIECPPDVTLDCDDEIWDLSPYGWAYVYGYGDPEPAGDPVVVYNLNSCGVGTITRTWTAYDYSNNPHSCTQYIYVGPNGGFSEANIHWPPHYETEECNPNLHPDYLPAPYDYPTYDNVDCSMIMIGYEDEVYNLGGGCIKILRTWKVLDWCVYNPGDPLWGGSWMYVQVLKVKPNGGIDLYCPDDITISAGPDCTGTYVSLPDVTGVGACGGPVIVSNNSPYANSHGANASGYYPFGQTIVKFTADDGCGNWEHCYVKITVKDMKKPTPICYHGLTANLMMNSDGYYIELDPKWFDKGSFDNCTPDHYLQFDIVPAVFTCDDLGRQDVRVYVTDQAGNTQFCNTYVIIADNMGMCPPIDTSSYAISGSMLNLYGDPIDQREIEVSSGSFSQFTHTDADGNYQVDGLLNSEDYMIVPQQSDEYMLGISTLDLIQVAKHIHSISLLDDPMQQFAGDVNQDGELNVKDLLILRQLLLNRIDNLPNEKSWRFLPANLLQSNMENIMDLDVDEYFELLDLNTDMADLDFIGIKLGDVNGSIKNISDSDGDRLVPLVFNIKTTESLDGCYLEFSTVEDVVTEGMQLSLQFNKDFEILDVESGSLDVDLGDFNQHEDKLLMSWISPTGDEVKAGEVLFVLKLSIDEISTIEEVKLCKESCLFPEVYLSGDKTRSIVMQLSIDNSETAGYEDEVKIYPNPAGTSDVIIIHSDRTALVDVNILTIEGKYVSGYKNINSTDFKLSGSSLKNGMYLIQTTLADGSAHYKKLLVNH
jgi:hypothetical protein